MKWAGLGNAVAGADLARAHRDRLVRGSKDSITSAAALMTTHNVLSSYL